MMHLYEEVGRLHIWEGQLKVLDDIDVTGLVDTDGFDFRGIQHGITELIGLRRSFSAKNTKKKSEKRTRTRASTCK